MSEKETLGVQNEVKELTAAEKAKKKKIKYTVAKIVVALCVVLCIVLTVFELGVTYRILKAAEVDGNEYSVAEYNWVYTTTVYDVYNDYYTNYGQLASYLFNPTKPLDEQQYSEDLTFADHIKKLADATLVEMTQLGKAGREAGYELPEERLAVIDEEWEAIKSTGQTYGYSAADYCEMTYGRGVNEKVFRKMYEEYLYAINYASTYANDQEVSAADIDAHYAENSENFDLVTYNYYLVSASTEEGEDETAAMAEAKEKAEKILNGEETTTVANEYKYAVKANINSLYKDWLFDSARVAGDKELFEAENGYYVVEFVELVDLHYNTVNVRHILITPETAEGEEAEKAAAQAALRKAEEYKAEWEANATEENFAELAAKYSADTSASNGGLIENIYKGQMVEEFEAWCFDEARKPGDSGIVETQYGAHIMYFSGEAEEYYAYTVENSVKAERYNEYLTGLTEGYEVTDLAGAKFTAKHFK